MSSLQQLFFDVEKGKEEERKEPSLEEASKLNEAGTLTGSDLIRFFTDRDTALLHHRSLVEFDQRLNTVEARLKEIVVTLVAQIDLISVPLSSQIQQTIEELSTGRHWRRPRSCRRGPRRASAAP